MNHPSPTVFTDALAGLAPLSRSPVRAAPAGRLIRPLERRDLEELADVFLRVFRGLEGEARRAAVPAVVAHLEELYLDCPWYDASRGSLVHLDATGAVSGFLGSIQLPMRFDGTPLLASAMGTFMVADRSRDARAAVDLLRHHVANGLDLHFTDTANRISLGFREGLKFELLPLFSLEWVLALRPARLAVDRAARRWPFLPHRVLDRLVRPLDARGRRMLGFEEAPLAGVVRRAGVSDFLAFAPARVARLRLRPDWTEETAGWLIDRASRRRGNGPLRIQALDDAEGRTIGLWLVYAEPGSVASLLQAFALPGRERDVLAAVIRDADDLGCLAVRGTTEPAWMQALYGVPGMLFHHKGATGLRATRPDVVEAVRAGDLSIGGLTGESWTRLVADRF